MQNCLKCGTKTQVYDSRLTEDGELRRKRKCPSCGARHATIEILDDVDVPFTGPRQPAPAKQPKKKPEPKGKPQPKTQGGSKKPARLMSDDDYEEDYTYTVDEMDFVRDVFGNGGGIE